MDAAKLVAEKIKSFADSKFVLKEHQVEGLKFMMKSYQKNHGCILADEMGLGKTCQAVSFLVHLNYFEKSCEKCLILCPLSVLEHWKKEIERFGCGLHFMVYQGVKEDREELRQKIKQNKEWTVILTSYEMALKDEEFFRKWNWTTVVVDEAHRLKNSESLLHQTLREFNVKHFLLLTGTPIQNNLDELYSLLTLLNIEKFPDSKRGQFLQRFSNSKNSKSFEELRELLEEYMIRRTKDLVCSDIPEKSEVVLFHGLANMQKKLYKAILAKNREIFNQNVKNKQKLMNTLMQLRKCVDHPYLFEGMEPEPFEEGDHLIKNCGKMVILDSLLTYLMKHKHKVLVFSQMTRMLDILQDYLTYRGYTYERLDGSVRGEERYAAINRFSSNASTFCFLLSTKAGGLGLTLTAADTVVFIDSDFNPQNDIQAAARAHRIGQDRPVKIIRLVARHTVEEYILKRAAQKMKLTNAILKNDENESDDQLTAAEISEMLMFGLSKLGENGANNDEQLLNEEELTKLIGESSHGKWNLKWKRAPSKTGDSNEKIEDDTAGDLYDFEGKNYRQRKDDDEGALREIINVDASSEREFKGKRAEQVYIPLGRPRPPAKVLTPEELEARRKRRAELAEQRKQREIENRKRREEADRLQKQKLWDRNNYVSAKLPDEEEKEDEEEEEKDEEIALLLDESGDETNGKNFEPIYVVGDVTHPKIRSEHSKMDAVVVHCVDNSGSWGKGGVFDSLACRSPKIVDSYKTAGKMDDLELGGVHLFSIDDVESRGDGRDYAALIVAQHYKNRSEMRYASLEEALKRVGEYASKRKCTVHLPRIGYGLAKFNWYGTERMIRKFLCRRDVPTYIYYYSRHGGKNREQKRNADDGDERMEKNKNVAGVSKKVRIDDDDDDCEEMQKTEPIELPNIFDGLTFCFVDVDDDTTKRLGRFIVAYDGQWTLDKKAAGVTHFVVEDDQQVTSTNVGLTEFTGDKSDVKIVTRDWLEKCIKAKRVVSV